MCLLSFVTQMQECPASDDQRQAPECMQAMPLSSCDCLVLMSCRYSMSCVSCALPQAQQA